MTALLMESIAYHPKADVCGQWLCNPTLGARWSGVQRLFWILRCCDPDTAEHCVRVHDHMVALAEALGLERRQRHYLSAAALLHDIGKLRVPADILYKEGQLTEQEWRIVERHAVEGEHLISCIVRSREVQSAIRSHHERYDGAGYPDGLRGDEIPLLAQLIGVSDTYDALTTRRTYHEALSASAALDVIRHESGRKFAPDLVERFAHVIESRSARLTASG